LGVMAAGVRPLGCARPVCMLTRMVAMNRSDEQDLAPAESDAVGIVVNSGCHVESHPRTVAFVWGKYLCPTPSLPFGRWKGGELSAA